VAGRVARLWSTLIVLSLWVYGAAAAEDPLGDIRDSGRLLIGIPDREISPFVMRGESGDWSGLDPAVARKLAGILDAEAVFVPLSGGTDAVLAAVAHDRVHLGMGRLSRRLGLAGRVSLSRPYTVVRNAVLYNRLVLARIAPGKRARSLLDRPGTRVGVLRDSAMQDYLSLAYPETLAHAFAEIQEASEALLDGETSLLIVDRPRLRHWLAHHAGIGLEAGYEELPGAGDALVIVLPWHRRRLLNWLNGTLDILEEQGVLASLRESHLESGITAERRAAP
jgi:ABC-type amino acid transport substrate-binding protein